MSLYKIDVPEVHYREYDVRAESIKDAMKLLAEYLETGEITKGEYNITSFVINDTGDEEYSHNLPQENWVISTIIE